MPNWMTTEVSFTGKAEDVLNFLNSGLDFDTVHSVPEGTKRNFNYYMNEGWKDVHIEGTDRCFLECNEDNVWCDIPADLEGCISGGMWVSCAWDIDVKGFTEISSRYHMTFSMTGEEGGNGIRHLFTVSDGTVCLDKVEDLPADYDSDEMFNGEPLFV